MKKGDRVMYNHCQVYPQIYRIDDIDPDGNCIIESEVVFDMGVTHQAIVEFAHVRDLKPVEEVMEKYPVGPASIAVKLQDEENVRKSKERK